MLKSTSLIFLIFLTLSCNNNSHESYFKTKNIGSKKLQNTNISLDTIRLNHIESSYSGEVAYTDNAIVFVDYRFCRLYLFDYEGKLTITKLGQGKGENEINTSIINRFSITNDSNYVFYGRSNDIHIFNKNFQKILDTTIEWNGETDYGNGRTLTYPNSDEPTIYSFDFANTKVITLKDKNYIPIYSEHSHFNGFIGQEYYKESNILAEIDLSDPSNINVSRILGRRTPELLKYKYLPHHSIVDFDIDSNGNFYISHEIDSLIYVYDNDFKIKYSFGFAGKNMDTNYQELDHLDVIKYRELFFNDRPKRGYYSDIKIFEEQNLIFRTYKKSFNSKYDGLQVYKNNVLIADINVPKNFKIRHLKNGYFYSNAYINEEKEELTIYKFKLKSFEK